MLLVSQVHKLDFSSTETNLTRAPLIIVSFIREFKIISSFVCSIDLMSQVINSQGLFVMQIEVDVYNLLKMWVYVRLHPDCTGSWKDVREQANAYFSSRASDYSAMNCFLETEEGKVFIPAFRSIRLHHVVNDLRSIQLLDTDRIIPQGIQYFFSWHTTLHKIMNHTI